jgi:mannosyltransferase OCH1-like enzyme
MIMNIPLELWQTYKSSNLPRQAIPLVQSWKNKNPQLTVNFMDDAQCNHFIKQNFDDEFYQMYISLPFGVMRADVWRVAVVYINGGIYADTDTDCIVSVSEWLKPDDRLIIAVEQSNGALANFIFAASPKHPALLHVLNTFTEFYNSPNFLDTNTDTPIQNFGQHGFSHGILSYYGLEDNESMSKGGTTNYYNDNPKVRSEQTKFILQQDSRITNGYRPKSYVVHVVASLYWVRFGYDSWRNEQKKKYGKFK